MSHEKAGKCNEWYTPSYIFSSLACRFDLDVASPIDKQFCNVPADLFITKDSLSKKWDGFVWMNPPFGNQKNKFLWISKFIKHGNGIALMPDRTSTSWWQMFASKSDAVLFVDKKIKFIRADGVIGEKPSTGTTLFAIGKKAVEALNNAEISGLGLVMHTK